LLGAHKKLARVPRGVQAFALTTRTKNSPPLSTGKSRKNSGKSIQTTEGSDSACTTRAPGVRALRAADLAQQRPFRQPLVSSHHLQRRRSNAVEVGFDLLSGAIARGFAWLQRPVTCHTQTSVSTRIGISSRWLLKMTVAVASPGCTYLVVPEASVFTSLPRPLLSAFLPYKPAAPFPPLHPYLRGARLKLMCKLAFKAFLLTESQSVRSLTPLRADFC